MRLLIAIGLYLIGIDSMGSYLAKNINQFPYLIDFFSGRNTFTLEGKYLYAGWSALIIGKTPMTATGRAAIAAAFVSGGFLSLPILVLWNVEAPFTNKEVHRKQVV